MYVQTYVYVHVCMYMKQKSLERAILYIVISGKEKDFSVYVFLVCTLCEVSFNYVPMSLKCNMGGKDFTKAPRLHQLYAKIPYSWKSLLHPLLSRVKLLSYIFFVPC